MKRDVSFFLMKKDQTIEEVLRRLGAQNIVLIVDDARRLLGTVTDGDARRAILERIALSSSVGRVMHTRPITAEVGVSEEDLLQLMLENDVKQLPIVDGDNVVRDLVTLEQILHRERRENTVFILAGGKGARLYPLTKDIPKPMLKVGERPILETIIRQLRADGFVNFFISVFYNKECIINHFGDGSKFGVNIIYTEETQPLGTAGPLACLRGKVDRPFLVINGDLLSKVAYGKFLDWHVDKGFSVTAAVRNMEFKIPFGVVDMTEDTIVEIQEKPVKEFRINAGLYALSPDILELIPVDTFYDMTDLFSDAISAHQGVGGYLIHDYWLDIGTRESYEQAQDAFRNIFAG